MHLVEAVLFLMALVIVSNVLSHYIVAVPVSLIQVALGIRRGFVFSFGDQFSDRLVHAVVHCSAAIL